MGEILLTNESLLRAGEFQIQGRSDRETWAGKGNHSLLTGNGQGSPRSLDATHFFSLLWSGAES